MSTHWAWEICSNLSPLAKLKWHFPHQSWPVVSMVRQHLEEHAYLPTIPIFPVVSKFFIKSPGLRLRAPDLLRNTYHGFFQIFFINFVIFKVSKTKIKQEVDLVLLFKLFLIGNNQIDIYLMSSIELVRNQPIKLHNTWYKAGAAFARCYRHRKHSKGLWVIFGEYLGNVENDILTMQRFLDVSRFLYSGGWQVWVCKQDCLKWLEIKPTTTFPASRGIFSLVFGEWEKKRSLFLPPASTREKRPLVAVKPHLRHTCRKTQQIPMPKGVSPGKGQGC